MVEPEHDHNAGESTRHGGRNEVSGTVTGPVVQAQAVHGGLHLHSARPEPVTPRQLPKVVVPLLVALVVAGGAVWTGYATSSRGPALPVVATSAPIATTGRDNTDPKATPPDYSCNNGHDTTHWFGISAGQDGNSNLLVDAGESKSPADLIVRPDNGGDNQQWCFGSTTYNGYTAYTIAAFYNGQLNCINVPDGNYSSGTHLLASPCTHGDNEKWFLCRRLADPSPNYSMEPVVPPSSSVWMDVRRGSVSSTVYVPGNPIEIWTGNGGDNQRFWLKPSPGSTFSEWPSATRNYPGCDSGP
jgi:hypothetical protein